MSEHDETKRPQLNIHLPTEDEFMAETTARHGRVWGYLESAHRQRLMADTLPQMRDNYRRVVAALEGPRERERTTVEWAMYRAFVDPLVAAETTIALRLWNLFEQAYQDGRCDERAEIRAGLAADAKARLGPVAFDLVAEQVRMVADEAQE